MKIFLGSVKKKAKFKLRSLKQMRAELEEITDEQERREWFEQVLKDYDKAEELNDLNHSRKEYRRKFDPHCLDQDPDEAICIPPVFQTLNNSAGWLDYIFSRGPEDLHELTEDEKVSRALRGLSRERRDALFYRGVYGYPASAVAALQGVSDRNVRKLYAKAAEQIRKAVDRGE